MGFPRTQDAALDFDTYFAMSSEERLKALMAQLSQPVTPDLKEDLQTIRERIADKHHEISKQREYDQSIPEPTLMQELLAAFSTRVETLKQVSDAKKKQIDAAKRKQKKQEKEAEKQEKKGAQKKRNQAPKIVVHNGQISLIDKEDETESRKDKDKKKNKRNIHPGCVIC